MRWSLEAPSTAMRVVDAARAARAATSWRPIAQIARRRSPRSSKTGRLPNASCAQIADRLGRLHLALDDRRRRATSASVCRPRMRSRRRRVTPEHDRLADAQVVDALRACRRPMNGVERGRLPPETSSWRPSCARPPRRARRAAPRFALVGHDRAVAGEARCRCRRRRRARSAATRSRNAGSSAGIMPSRRSPTSTIATTP